MRLGFFSNQRNGCSPSIGLRNGVKSDQTFIESTEFTQNLGFQKGRGFWHSEKSLGLFAKNRFCAFPVNGGGMDDAA